MKRPSRSFFEHHPQSFRLLWFVRARFHAYQRRLLPGKTCHSLHHQSVARSSVSGKGQLSRRRGSNPAEASTAHKRAWPLQIRHIKDELVTRMSEAIEAETKPLSVSTDWSNCLVSAPIRPIDTTYIYVCILLRPEGTPFQRIFDQINILHYSHSLTCTAQPKKSTTLTYGAANTPPRAKSPGICSSSC